MSKFHKLQCKGITTYVHNTVPGLRAYAEFLEGYDLYEVFVSMSMTSDRGLSPCFISKRTVVCGDSLTKFWGYGDPYWSKFSRHGYRTQRFGVTSDADEVVSKEFAKVERVYHYNKFKMMLLNIPHRIWKCAQRIYRSMSTE